MPQTCKLIAAVLVNAHDPKCAPQCVSEAALQSALQLIRAKSIFDGSGIKWDREHQNQKSDTEMTDKPVNLHPVQIMFLVTTLISQAMAPHIKLGAVQGVCDDQDKSSNLY